MGEVLLQTLCFRYDTRQGIYALDRASRVIDQNNQNNLEPIATPSHLIDFL